MTNPQDRITISRQLLAPPPRPASTATAEPYAAIEPSAVDDHGPATTTTTRRSANRDTIGKRQGKRRCVGFYLDAPTQHVLRALVATRGTTIAEVVLSALRQLHDSGGLTRRVDDDHPAFPIDSRARHRRNLDNPSIVYALFTDREAAALKEAATNAGTTVSALVSAAFATTGTNESECS